MFGQLITHAGKQWQSRKLVKFAVSFEFVDYRSRRPIDRVVRIIRHLNRWGPEGEEKLRKHFGDALPSDFKIKITNPCGIVIMGRDKGLLSAQLRDFEVTRRHYKHIADIVTYDDLLRRLGTVLNQLRAGG